MSKKVKITIISLSSVVAFLFLTIVSTLGGYFIHVLNSYSRIEDNLNIEIKSCSKIEHVSTNKKYSVTSYNIGFGAYSQNYSFFLDTSVTTDGKNNTGKYGKALSKEEVLFNTNGAIETILNLNPDFAIFQEVDTDSTRSYHVNQYEMIKEKFNGYDSHFALNFHTAYLPYPLHDMHGKSNAGLTTFSRFQIAKATRKSLKVADDLSKLFDLDRCYTISEFKTDNNKTLIIVNIHMSAYDDGGIRDIQLEQLNTYLKSVNNDDHYVIVGGDFNHDLLTYNPLFNYNDENPAFKEYKSFKQPQWLAYLHNSDGTSRIINPFIVYASDNAPTNRDASVEWSKGNTYASTIDGFICSPNVEVVSIKTIVTSNGNKNVDHFAYSDHDPVLLEFILK